MRPTPLLRLFLVTLLSALSLALAHAATALNLTAEDKAWLEKHPVIRVGYDPNWPPFCFTNADGELDGLDRGTLDLLQEILGIRFEIINHATWTQALEAGKNREVDLLCSTGETEDRKAHFLFTDPYLYLPHVFISKNNVPPIATAEDLAKKSVALPRDYTITHKFTSYYPDAQIRLYSSETECLEAVSRGEVDITVAQIATATLAIRSGKYWDLHFVGVYTDPTVFRYAVRNDWPALASILNKAVKAIPEEHRQALYNKWVNQNIPQLFPWRVIIGITLAAALLVLLLKAFLLYRNHLLSQQLKLRQELLEKIEKQSALLSTISTAKSNLLRTLSHDLRSPLSSILLNLGLIKSDPDSQPHLSEIDAQTHAMALFLDNILTAQSIDDGAAHYPITPLNIAALTRATALTFSQAAAQKQLRIEIDAASCPPSHPLNETAWRQILQNLLTNALKFSHPGGLIHLLLATDDNRLVFTIQDNGPGLSPADCATLFALYARGSASPTSGEQTHGIGLSVVRELVTKLGGVITCENASPGARFRIEFKPTWH